MVLRVLPAILAVVYCCASAPGAQAQGKTVKALDLAALEHRLKELEDRVRKLTLMWESGPAVVLEIDRSKSLAKKSPAPEAPKAEPKLELNVYNLKNADAIKLTEIVQKLLRGMNTFKFSLVAEPRTNSILFYGQREAADLIEALLARLDEAAPKTTKAPK